MCITEAGTVHRWSFYMNWRFGGTYHLHLQGRKLAEEESVLARHLPTHSLHGAVSQKKETFITAAVRTSNPMHCTSGWVNINEERQDGRMVGRALAIINILHSTKHQ
jgi:hypothetical protein